MKAADFAGQQPALRLEAYFDGTLRAYGMFQDRFGNIRRRFVADVEGRWDGRTLELSEDFRFDDGEEDRRVWHIEPQGEHGYTGRSDGVDGVVEGQAFGPVFHWRYVVSLKFGDRRLKVRIIDWLVLHPDGILVNRARVKKFGVLLGELTLVFHRQAPRGT